MNVEVVKLLCLWSKSLEEYTPYRLYEFDDAVHVRLHNVTWRGIIADDGHHQQVHSEGGGRWFATSMNYRDLAEFVEVVCESPMHSG